MFILVIAKHHACARLGDIPLEQKETGIEESHVGSSDLNARTENTDCSLSLTVEGFRREFEHLPESVYDEFRRLCEDNARRLRQLGRKQVKTNVGQPTTSRLSGCQVSKSG